MILHCTYITHLLYPFIHRWTFVATMNILGVLPSSIFFAQCSVVPQDCPSQLCDSVIGIFLRFSSVQLLGDLLFHISGVTGKMTTETASEDDNFGTAQSNKVRASSWFSTCSGGRDMPWYSCSGGFTTLRSPFFSTAVGYHHCPGGRSAEPGVGRALHGPLRHPAGCAAGVPARLEDCGL